MFGDRFYLFFANVVLLVHVAVVLFVVGGLVLIVVGNVRRWQWVNGLAFRAAHLGAILFVAAEAWFGVDCPLTILEMSLRAKAGAVTYGEAFVQHWLQWLLYYNAPSWVFVLGYSVFALMVAAAWWRFPPKRRPHARTTHA
jgi:Protein of Unknown function (DUF2784)